MGIKGIYKEIGPGKRISLTKLAVDHLEETGRPFRLAIDISIWQFQAQAAKGGSNPAIRTLFYRLLRLLSLSIQPIFVFDGPNKPVFKRNKRSGRGDGVATSMAKRLIRLFGFLVHDAPGEAEAECALLQQQGIVDAVLSEDVDTIMFGCRRTLRNWSAEGTKAKTPTHVSMYDAEGLQQGASGLDREGMVLVALMSGGDYVTEGIPGAGVKLACEAARAGFGKRLCQLKKSDTSGLNSWREWLLYELRTNESGFFRTKHKALHVPDSFPNLDVLRYYTHPVVSPASVVDRLRVQTWEKPIDVEGLREFGRETFDWNYRIGAIKFIRVLAPGLLVRKLMDRSSQSDSRSEDIDSIQEEESKLVGAIKSRRTHSSTDETPELRISFIPTDIVGYAFEEEPDEVISYGRDGLALNSDDEFEGEDEAGVGARPAPKKPFSPTETDLHWVPETIAKLGVPLTVEDWEAKQRTKASVRQKPKTTKQKTKPSGTSSRAMDKFVRVTKNIPKSTDTSKPDKLPSSQPQESTPSAMRTRSSLDAAAVPSQSLPPPSSMPTSQQLRKTRASAGSSKQLKSTSTAMRSSKSTERTSTSSRRRKPAAAEESNTVNPWTIASSQVTPRGAKFTTTGTKTDSPTRATRNDKPTMTQAPSEAIIISSSPPTSPVARARPITRSRQQQQSQQRPSSPPSPPPQKETNLGRITPSPPPSSSLPSSPLNKISPPRNKRPSITPPPASPQIAPDEFETPVSGRATGISPPPSERSRCKLARTEKRTGAVEVMVLSSDEEGEHEDGERPGSSGRDGAGKGNGTEGSDIDDPRPANSFVDKSPGGNAGGDVFTSSPPEPKPEPQRAPTTPTASRHKQTTLDSPDAWGGGGGGGRPRMTKLYVPRKSQPGFFKEIDVTADEAEALKAHVARAGAGPGRGRAWRRSDIQCVDLTGED